MKTNELLNRLVYLFEGEIKTAWEFYQNLKKNEPSETLNVTGWAMPNVYESAKIALSELVHENNELIKREFRITDVLLKVIENKDV